MNILYIVTGLAISLLYVLYKFIINYTSELSESEKTTNNKQLFKEGFILFLISAGSNYFITEFLYNDYLSNIYNNMKQGPISNTLKSPEVFTDKPGF
tara:strand:+ start:75 stop:365 length:291 start_codon:yes stop_codon:yes gene_type:complete